MGPLIFNVVLQLVFDYFVAPVLFELGAIALRGLWKAGFEVTDAVLGLRRLPSLLDVPEAWTEVIKAAESLTPVTIDAEDAALIESAVDDPRDAAGFDPRDLPAEITVSPVDELELLETRLYALLYRNLSEQAFGRIVDLLADRDVQAAAAYGMRMLREAFPNDKKFVAVAKLLTKTGAKPSMIVMLGRTPGLSAVELAAGYTNVDAWFDGLPKLIADKCNDVPDLAAVVQGSQAKATVEQIWKEFSKPEALAAKLAKRAESLVRWATPDAEPFFDLPEGRTVRVEGWIKHFGKAPDRSSSLNLLQRTIASSTKIKKTEFGVPVEWRGGHLFGHAYGGPETAENIVPMTFTANNSTMQTLDNALKKFAWDAAGNPVPIYLQQFITYREVTGLDDLDSVVSEWLAVEIRYVAYDADAHVVMDTATLSLKTSLWPPE
jgi:hypothetical protein